MTHSPDNYIRSLGAAGLLIRLIIEGASIDDMRLSLADHFPEIAEADRNRMIDEAFSDLSEETGFPIV